MGRVMQQMISQKKLMTELAGGAGKKSSSPPITDVGHTADEHNARGGGDAPTGLARKGVRIPNKAGPTLGLGGRGGTRNRNGGGLNIGGY